MTHNVRKRATRCYLYLEGPWLATLRVGTYPSRRDICLRHGLPPPTHYSRNWDMSRGRIYVPRYLEINAIYYRGSENAHLFGFKGHESRVVSCDDDRDPVDVL